MGIVQEGENGILTSQLGMGTVWEAYGKGGPHYC